MVLRVPDHILSTHTETRGFPKPSLLGANRDGCRSSKESKSYNYSKHRPTVPGPKEQMHLLALGPGVLSGTSRCAPPPSSGHGVRIALAA